MAINNTFKPIPFTEQQKKTWGQGLSFAPLKPSPKIESSITQPGGLIKVNQPATISPVQTAAVPKATPQPVATQQIVPQVVPQISSSVPPAPIQSSYPAQPQPIRGLFPNVVTSLAQSGDRNRELAEKAEQISNKYAQQIAELGTAGARARAGRLSTGTVPVAEGTAAIAAQSTAAAQQALSDAAEMELRGVGQGLTAQQQTQEALRSAAGVTQPQVAEYGRTVFDPVTGTYVDAGGSMEDVIQNYASLAAQNQISPSQIPSSIINNPVLLSQFIQAAKSANPSFNAARWEAEVGAIQSDIAQTGTLGGPIAKAAGSAYESLDLLQNAYDSLSSLQQGGILGRNVPVLSQLAQNVSLLSGVGRESASAYQGALREARAAISAVLAPVIGVEGAGGMSMALLPDNMVPEEIPQKIAAAKEYIDQRVRAFTSEGGVGAQQASGSSIWSW